MLLKNIQVFIRYNLVVTALLAVCLLSCKTVQKVPKEDQYFKVALYSIGSGIDQQANNMVKNTIKAYEEKGYTIKYEKQPWGREGEINYCFDLKELDPKVYAAFLKELKSQLSGKQVHIYEKSACGE